MARGARRAAAFDRRHFERYAVAVPPFLTVRYRSVIGDARFRILASANNARLHSATYLLVRGRHCRRAVVASLVAEITRFSHAFSFRSLARSHPRSQLVTVNYATPSSYTPLRTPNTAILGQYEQRSAARRSTRGWSKRTGRRIYRARANTNRSVFFSWISCTISPFHSSSFSFYIGEKRRKNERCKKFTWRE